MVKALVIASIAWPLLLAGAALDRARHSPAGWSSVVYLAASRVCHQRPERSFHTAGVQWPVCGRCSGLYLSAPLGALAAAATVRRSRARRHAGGRAGLVAWLVVASVPTLLTVLLEWTSLASVTNAVRAIAALPLGAALAAIVVHTAAGPGRTIE